LPQSEGGHVLNQAIPAPEHLPFLSWHVLPD
jgi:hypothetical protein